MSNHGHRGVLSFRIQISPPCSECPIPCPPLVTCLVRLFTQQPLRNISSSSSSSSSSFDLRFGFFDIHLPRHFNFCKQTGEAKERRRFSMLRLDRNFPFVLSKRWLATAWRPYWQAQWCRQKRAQSYVGFCTEWSPRPLWHNYLSYHPFSNWIYFPRKILTWTA